MATDEELFAEATADEEPVAAEATETQRKPQEAPKPDDKSATVEPTPELAKPEQQDHRVPLVELLNEREKRQNYERQIEDERRHRQALERRIAEFQRQQEPKPQTPDIFENPQGFVETLEQKFERKLREQEANFSLKMAHRQHRKEFETAYENLIREGQSNPAVVQSIVAHSDPGEALMLWHKQRTLMEKVGGDFDGYMKKREEELLNDPEFRKRFADTLRAEQSSSNPNQRPAPQVQMPPSLSKTSGAAPRAADDDDISNEALFRHATRR